MTMEEATKREIIRLRRQGATYPEISNLVGYGLKSIQKVIGENAPELAKMKIPRLSLDRKRTIARAYYEEALTEKEVKAKYGIGGYTLNKIRLQFREEYGIPVRKLYEKWLITRTQLRRYGIIQANGNRAK